MNLNHPKVKKIVRQCERRIMKLTGRSKVKLLILNAPANPVPYEQIEKIVCEVTGIRIELATQQSRKHEYRTTRQLICFYARTHTVMSYRLIGVKVNRRDHTTIISSIRRIKGLIESGDPEVSHLVKEITARIEQLKVE